MVNRSFGHGMPCPNTAARKRERMYEKQRSRVMMPRRVIHGESIKSIGRNAIPWCAVLALFCASLSAQQPGIQNPYTSADDEAAGARLFRPFCAICHGLNGNGTPGIGRQIRRGSPDRTTDAELYETIRDGIPGTGMPPFTFSEKERWQVVAYVQSLRRTAGAEESAGGAARGAKLFRGKGGCSKCHTVRGEGGRRGPDLSHIGGDRSLDELKRSILNPNEKVSPAYWELRATTREGTRVTGRRLNEDTFSLQLLDSQERLISVIKSDLEEYELDENSVMPSFERKLNQREITDLVAYLAALRPKGGRR